MSGTTSKEYTCNYHNLKTLTQFLLLSGQLHQDPSDIYIFILQLCCKRFSKIQITCYNFNSSHQLRHFKYNVHSFEKVFGL